MFCARNERRDRKETRGLRGDFRKASNEGKGVGGRGIVEKGDAIIKQKPAFPHQKLDEKKKVENLSPRGVKPWSFAREGARSKFAKNFKR